MPGRLLGDRARCASEGGRAFYTRHMRRHMPSMWDMKSHGPRKFMKTNQTPIKKQRKAPKGTGRIENTHRELRCGASKWAIPDFFKKKIRNRSRAPGAKNHETRQIAPVVPCSAPCRTHQSLGPRCASKAVLCMAERKIPPGGPYRDSHRQWRVMIVLWHQLALSHALLHGGGRGRPEVCLRPISLYPPPCARWPGTPGS